MNILYPLPNAIVFEGRRYPLDLSYDTVLKVFAVYANTELSSTEQAEYAVALLVRRKAPTAILTPVFKEHISITGKKSLRQSAKSFDFQADSSYLYSSFLMDYGVDLFTSQRRLHWQKFLSMFQGLSARTKMREVMSIRQRPIPEPTKHNAKEIEELMRLKSYYALTVSQEEREQQMQNALADLAGALRYRAEKGG